MPTWLRLGTSERSSEGGLSVGRSVCLAGWLADCMCSGLSAVGPFRISDFSWRARCLYFSSPGELWTSLPFLSPLIVCWRAGKEPLVIFLDLVGILPYCPEPGQVLSQSGPGVVMVGVV